MTEKPNLLGYIVLGKSKTDNAYRAIIERSFSMDLSADRALFFWSSTEASSPLLNALTGKKTTFTIDGMEEAVHYRDHFVKRNPDMEFEIFDVHSENLPVELDWDDWRWANEPADTLSGVRDKFKARNVPFKMREDQ